MPIYDCGAPDCLACEVEFREPAAHRVIKTHYDPPPIPYRGMDWTAVDDRTYGGDPGDPVGYGATEAAAVADLLEKLEG